MTLRNVLVALGTVAALTLAMGCSDAISDICDKAQECAKKSGEAFSRTECENELKAQKEKAETKGCEDQYDDYLECVNDIDLECGDDLSSKIQGECGSKINALGKCLQ